MKEKIPIKDKLNLTIKEASEYSGIGEKSLRDYVRENPSAQFVLYVGNKILIKRKELEEWNSINYIVH